MYLSSYDDDEYKDGQEYEKIKNFDTNVIQRNEKFTRTEGGPTDSKILQSFLNVINKKQKLLRIIR